MSVRAAGRIFAVVPAAGVGRRMGGEVPKQYLVLAGRTVLEHTLARIAGHAAVAGVAIAIAADDDRFAALAPGLPPACRVVTGGAERCHSVLAGLDALAGAAADDDWALVHDAARPCVRGTDIDRMLGELAGHAVGGILAVPVRDTLKRCDAAGNITATVDREHLWHALTPQMFRFGTLRQALRDALDSGRLVTDEAQAIEGAGLVPRVVAGHADNIKITHPADLALAELILAAQARA
ncbi:MAG: 2-C-methyl-D-erythritol 4-phosphate cytidylyltransferase [Gammaproteobacteria bacterium]